MENNKKWNFWIDRGGTFTDIVAIDPKGHIHSKKILSNKTSSKEDAVLEGIKYFTENNKKNISSKYIDEVIMGTTVATNNLLTRKGKKTALFITRGFKDALKIGNQTRPDIFARAIKAITPLYSNVYEINERVLSDGRNIIKPSYKEIKNQMKKALKNGCKSAAIVLMHSWSHPKNEKLLEKKLIP